MRRRGYRWGVILPIWEIGMQRRQALLKGQIRVGMDLVGVGMKEKNKE